MVLTNGVLLVAVGALWLLLSIERDYQARRLSDNAYGTPEHTDAQNQWHFAGGFQRAILGAYMVVSTLGLGWFSFVVYLHAGGWWWLLFDLGYNIRTGKRLAYAGEFAKSDKFSISIARWVKNTFKLEETKEFIPLAFKLAFLILTGIILSLL